MKARLLTFALFACLGGGCISAHDVRVDPVRVEPIHMTVDVNLRLDADSPEPAPRRPGSARPR